MTCKAHPRLPQCTSLGDCFAKMEAEMRLGVPDSAWYEAWREVEECAPSAPLPPPSALSPPTAEATMGDLRFNVFALTHSGEVKS